MGRVRVRGIADGCPPPLMAASEPLWDVLASLGWTDTYGGTESKLILPAALLGIRKLVNVGVNTNASYLGFEVTPGERGGQRLGCCDGGEGQRGIRRSCQVSSGCDAALRGTRLSWSLLLDHRRAEPGCAVRQQGS